MELKVNGNSTYVFMKLYKCKKNQIRNFHTFFTNMCFRERRGESLQVYQPVSLSLKHNSFILRGLRARLFQFGRGLQLHFLSGSTDRSFYFRLGVGAFARCAGSWTDDFGRFCISFLLFLNSRKPLSFSFLSI